MNGGLDKLLKQFEHIENLDWVQAETKGLEIVAEEARSLVPVDTGDLQSTIRVQVDGDTVQLVAGGEGVDYSLYVELGTSKMRAQPYVRPAIDNKQNEMLRAIADNLEEQIRRAV